MSRFASERCHDPWRGLRLAALSLLLAGAAACGLTVTNERPTYEALEQPERDAVDVILAELTAFAGQVKARTTVSIDAIVDREKIHVSFEGFIFAANLGDGVVHVSTWENLSAEQQALVQKWFGRPDPASARDAYRTFFYRFMAASQGAKQYMYDAVTTEWLFANRSLFNVERDSIRTALSHYQATGQQAEMWGFVESVCAPLLAQYEPLYGPTFDKRYLRDNFTTLAEPRAPTGYMYYICRWYQLGVREAENLTVELNWLSDLRETDT
jgi:hypothetical protein